MNRNNYSNLNNQTIPNSDKQQEQTMKRVLYTAIALILIGTTVSFAQHGKGMDAPMPGMMPPGHPPMGMGMHMDCGDGACMKCMHGVKFTDEQQAKIDKMRLEGKKNHLEKKSMMLDLQTKLKLAMVADKYNQNEIDDIAAKMGKIHQDGVQMRAKNMHEVREMLTPEQRVKFDQSILDGNMGHDGPGKGFMKGRGMGKGRGCEECGGDDDDDDDDDDNHHRGHGHGHDSD